MRTDPRIQRAVDAELTKFERASANITRAWRDDAISEHDREERIARAAAWRDGRIAWITGGTRPPMRVRQPLDNPNAGRIG